MRGSPAMDDLGSYLELPSFRKKRTIVTSLLSICCLAILYASMSIVRGSPPLATRQVLTSKIESRFESTSSAARAQLYRTAFHFQPAKNWMNDPNGPMYYKGFYHLFYQYNPEGASWGNLTWGHAVSKDIIHWLDLELSLKCDHWYDIQGVWSGSVTIRPDGSPMILYTGISNSSEQTQSMAVPEDVSDLLLRKWVKVPANPLIRHPNGIDKQDFRDPTTAWQVDDGSWRITVGTKVGTTGMALLYKSDDLQRWELDDNLLHAVPGTGMWECIDFFPVASTGRKGLDTSAHGPSTKHVLKVSFYDNKHDYYALGTYNELTGAFTPNNPGLDVGLGFRYDYGKVYASKSFFDPVKERRILWGWSNESDSEAQDIAKGWASLQTIPRTVWLDNMTGVSLLQAPVEEVDALRGSKVSNTALKLEAGKVVKVKGSSGGQLDVEVVFEYPNVSKDSIDDDGHLNDQFDCSKGGSAHQGTFGPFGLLVLTDDDFNEQTAVFFYISKSKNRSWVTHFCSDQSRSTLLPDIDTTVFWSDVRVLPTENFLSLRVLVDHSIIESFVQGGRVVITSRVYPKEAVGERAHIFIFNNGTFPISVRNIDVWQMNGVTIPAI